MTDDFEAAKGILAPYTGNLSKGMRGGFSRFDELPPAVKKDLRATTKAGVVHDLQVKEFENIFKPEDGLEVVKLGELSLLLIEDTFAVKIKKLNQNRKSRSQQTQQVEDFQNQSLCLPGFQKITSLELGYTLDEIGDIEDVYIVCPNGRYDNFWEWGFETGNENVHDLLRERTSDLEEKQEKTSTNRYTSSTGEEVNDEHIGANKGDHK